MLTAKHLRASASAAGLVVCGGLAIAIAVAVVTAPLTPRLANAQTIVAQTIANPNDQPTAGTLPQGTATVKRDPGAADRATGNVPPPSRIRSSTDIVDGPGTGRTDPLDHLSPEYRRSKSD